jgi:hypothetical protein
MNTHPVGPEPHLIHAASPDELLAAVPHLLGFVPENSLVVIGTGPRGQVIVTLRFDLPGPADAGQAADIAGYARHALASSGATGMAAVGYGPGPLVTPLADALRAQTTQPGPRLLELLRADGGRYWSYLCPGTCHPGEGAVPAPVRVPGPAPLASRAVLAASIAPLEGQIAAQMTAETSRCERIAARYYARAGVTPGTPAASHVLAKYGSRAVTVVIGAYRAGRPVPAAGTLAWLSVTLTSLRVRDLAWAYMAPGYAPAHQRLWTDLTRRARPGYIAAPASLLAFVAWQDGNGALARLALDRAQADDPGYSMARILRSCIQDCLPPAAAHMPELPLPGSGTADIQLPPATVSAEAGHDDRP